MMARKESKICVCCGEEKSRVWFKGGRDCIHCLRVISRIRKRLSCSLKEARIAAINIDQQDQDNLTLSEVKQHGQHRLIDADFHLLDRGEL